MINHDFFHLLFITANCRFEKKQTVRTRSIRNSGPTYIIQIWNILVVVEFLKIHLRPEFQNEKRKYTKHKNDICGKNQMNLNSMRNMDIRSVNKMNVQYYQN